MIDVSKIIPSENVIIKDKLLLLICNTYSKTDLELGEPVYNDCVMISNCYQSHGYQSIMVRDVNMKCCVEWLIMLSKIKFTDVVIYYSGHGTTIEQHQQHKAQKRFKKKVGIDSLKFVDDEEIDSAYVFYDYEEDRSELLCDDIVTQLMMLFVTTPFVISDCCHSGTIIDSTNPLTKETFNHQHKLQYMSACMDNQYALQTHNNGLFTSYICKHFETRSPTKLIRTFNEKYKDIVNQTAQGMINETRQKMWI